MIINPPFFARRRRQGWHCNLCWLYVRYENVFSDYYVRVGRLHLHIYKQGYRPRRWHLGREDWGQGLRQAWGIKTPWFSFYP